MSERPRRIFPARRGEDQPVPVDSADEELVRRVRNGDTAALETLYSRYGRVV